MTNSFPEELSYFSSKLEYSRQWTRLLPKNTTVANAEDTTIFEIDSGIIDLSSICVMGDLLGVKSSDPQNISLPTNIESYVESLSVYLNNIEIFSCRDFNHLWRLFVDFKHADTSRSFFQLRDTYTSTKTKLASIGIADQAYGVTKVGNSVPVAVKYPSSSQNAHPFILKNIPGLLSCGKTLDLDYVGKLTIRLRWASGNIVATGDASFQVQNIVMEQALETSGIEFRYKQFASFRGPNLTSSATIRFYVQTRSLDALYTILTSTEDNVVAGTSGYFDRSSGAIENMQYIVDDTQYPSFQCTPLESYVLLENAMGVRDAATSIDLIPSNTMHLDDYMFDKFAFCYRFDQKSTKNPREIPSGLSKTIDAFDGQLVLNLSKTNGQLSEAQIGRPIVYAEYTSSVFVYRDRKILLVP